MTEFNNLCTYISDLQRMIDSIDGTDFGKLETLFDEMKKTADKAANLSERIDLAAMPILVEALQEISAAHLGDQPESAPGNERVWAMRHIGKIRGMADTALARVAVK